MPPQHRRGAWHPDRRTGCLWIGPAAFPTCQRRQVISSEDHSNPHGSIGEGSTPVLLDANLLSFGFLASLDGHGYFDFICRQFVRLIWHAGADAGYRTVLAWFPELDAGLIVLANSTAFDMGAALNGVAEAFLGSDLAPVRPETASPTSSAALQPWRPSEGELAVYEGRYFSEELETVYTVQVDGGQLIARHRRGDILLDPVERDVFGRRLWYFRTARFERDSTGRVVALRVSGPNTRDVLFRRMP